jgi:hypothetical protein
MEFVTCEDGGMAEVRFHTKPKIGFKALDLSEQGSNYAARR